MPINRKLLTLQVLLGLVLAIFTWSLVVAGDPGGKKRVEEEDDKPPAQAKDKPGKKRAEEEEDKPTTSEVNRLVDAATPVKKATVPSVDDLAQAANQTRHPKLKALYSNLAIPHDMVTIKRLSGVTVGGDKTGGRLRVEPVPLYIPDIREMKGRLMMNVIDDEGNSLREESGTATTIVQIRYYEQVAMDEVKEFLEQKFTSYDSAHPLYLTRMDQLLAAEKVLSTALRFHDSARQTGKRKGDAWEELEGELRTRLLAILLNQMEVLADNRSWDEAFVLTRRIVDTYTAPGDHKLIATPLADLLRRALSDPNFTQDRMKEARERLRRLENQFPNSEVLRPISESLQAHAKRLFELANEMRKQGKIDAALVYVQQAEETWPELPGLRTLRIEIDQTYQVLEVGMRTMPQFLSPGWACTDSELRAVDLLFESLVSLTPDESGALYYRPALAEGRPGVLQLGRLFKLPRNAKWSDDRPLTVGDLRYTVQQLQAGKLVGRPAAWGELLSVVQVEGDPFRVKLRLNQGLLNPLAAMSFKLLPMRSSPDPTSQDFARQPISSGPFQFTGRRSNPLTNQQYAAFEANANYGVRAEKLRLPRIKEVRIYQVDDPVKPMVDGKLDMVMDLTAEQAAALSQQGGFEVPMPTPRTVNRRIWFLAVNHRNHVLGNADIRIALARAIPREQLLEAHFRKGLGAKVHRALNGPYPAGSWACDPRLGEWNEKTSLDPYDADLARAKLKQGLNKLNLQQVKLSVKYPLGDPVAAEAIQALCDTVEKSLPGVRLVPEPRSPYDLRSEVEDTHSFDLAYYHYDHVDETYWLMPLLGPIGRGGAENYLGYTGSLVGKIRQADALRHFPQVKEYTHAIHRQFLESDMPFIPLWQLDGLYAYRRGGLELPVLDPQRLFDRVEEWTVRRRR